MDKSIVGIRFFGNKKIYYFNNPTNFPFNQKDIAVVINSEGIFNEVLVVNFRKPNFPVKKDIYPKNNIANKGSASLLNKQLPEI